MLKSKIESLLFVSAKELNFKEIAKILGIDEMEVEKNINELSDEYKNKDRGMQIIINNKACQLVSNGKNASIVEKFSSKEFNGELSQPSLETLTIIAYRGHITKWELNKIRGVNCALILRNLILRGLIKFETKNEEDFYTISLDFLKFLGINKVNELPDFEKLNNNKIINEILENKEKE